jgi:hypothetical protein
VHLDAVEVRRFARVHCGGGEVVHDAGQFLGIERARLGGVDEAAGTPSLIR